MKCPKCNKEILNDQRKCECGFEMVPKEKKKAKKILLLCVFAFLALIIVASLFIPGGKSSHDYVIAQSKNSLYLIDAARPKKDPVLISKLTGESALSQYYINSDSTKLLYMNNAQTDEDTYNTYYDLYLYDIAEGTSSIVDKNIFSHIVNEEFDTFTYFKGKDGELWQKKINEEAKKLLDKTYSVKISDDLSSVYYTDKEGGLYLVSGDNEPQVISEKADVVSFGDKDVLYCEDGKLIKYENGKTAVINDNFYTGLFMSSGCGYFLADKKPIDFSGYFIDDMLQSDKNISPSDIEAYSEKLIRDAMRLEFASSEQSALSQLCSLYYYDGACAVLVCENVLDTLYDSAIYSDKGDDSLIVYRVLESYDLPKIKMSEFYEENDEFSSIDEIFYGELNSQSILTIAKDGKQLGNTELKDVDSYLYNKETKTLYLHTMTEIDEENYEYDLKYYTLQIKDDSITTPELFAENASYDVSDFAGNELVYCKYDEEEEFIDLYVGKKLLFEKADSAEWLNDSVLYINKTDENDEPCDMLYENSALTKVEGADEYENKILTEKGNVLFYTEDSKDAAVMTNGKIIPLSGDVKYTYFYVPEIYTNYYEMTSPIFFEDIMSNIF